MKLVSFCILTTLSLIYAGLTMMETVTYHKWEAEVNNQKYLQAQVNYFDHLNAILDEMLKRTAYLSQHDPALAQMLKDHNINVVVENPTTPPPASTSSFDAPASAQSPDKSASTPPVAHP
jgi:hypothetical protein